MTDDVSSKLLECRTYKASFKYFDKIHVQEWKRHLQCSLCTDSPLEPLRQNHMGTHRRRIGFNTNPGGHLQPGRQRGGQLRRRLSQVRWHGAHR